MSCSYLYKNTKGAKEHAEYGFGVLFDVINWGREKGLDDPKAQLNKVMEEVGEIAHEITRNHYDLNELEQPDELVDAIGDTLVTVVILSDILGIDPIDALSEAYEQIKDRKGKTSNGTFVKEEDGKESNLQD